MDGLKKCVELDTFPGVFSDSQGTLYDLRPQELCPSLNNFRKKSSAELKELVSKALQAQLDELTDPNFSKYNESFEVGLVKDLRHLIDQISRTR